MRPNAKERAIAKERNHFLWSLTLDGRTREPQEDTLEMCGPLSPERADELLAMLRRWRTEGPK